MAWSKDVREFVRKKFEELGKVRATARALGMVSSTVSDIINYHVPITEKRGRPKSLTRRDTKKIKRMVRVSKEIKKKSQLKKF